MNKLIFYSPHVIVDEHIVYVCGYLIRSISFDLNHPQHESFQDSKNNSDLILTSLLHQELKSFTIDILYKYSSILKDKLIPHLSTICSACISIAQSPQLTTKIRHQSLVYLLEICTIYPYYQLFPVKVGVLRGLASIVDDKKRAIRILAAKLRNAWSVISHNS